MAKEFQQHEWGPLIDLELQRLLEIAISEDLETYGDLTSLALISEHARGSASIHVREPGVIAGVPAVSTVLKAVDKELQWNPATVDGARLSPGECVGVLQGPARSLLAAERPVLNLLGRLSGIATQTRRYVDAVAGTGANIYDTRKTTLGWRRLEKYAVRCGGGRNHRMGLFDAILIKDNHLAFGREEQGSGATFGPAEAVLRARSYLERLPETLIAEIEVDTLEQLREVLPSRPDIVLLDNMSPDILVEAVKIRNETAPDVELEASGGINLNTVRAVAETGVERISVGALTHAAIFLDFGLDWN